MAHNPTIKQDKWGLHIQPEGDEDYAAVIFKDHNGNDIAQISTHEKAAGGAVHKHLSIYTANASGQQTARVHIYYDDDKPRIEIGNAKLFLWNNADFVMKSPDGGEWYVQIDDNGVITTTKNP